MHRVNLHAEVSLHEISYLVREPRVAGACSVHHQFFHVFWSCAPGASAVHLLVC